MLRLPSPRKPGYFHFSLMLPSLLLILWAAFLAVGFTNKPLTIFMLVALALAFCNEERVRYNYRRRRAAEGK